MPPSWRQTAFVRTHHRAKIALCQQDVTHLSPHGDMSRPMDNDSAVRILLALAQPTRLLVFRRLIEVFPGDVRSGEIARLCGVPHNTMSAHLAVLTRAALITAQRQGRAKAYRLNVLRYQELLSFLTTECCNEKPEICSPFLELQKLRCSPGSTEDV